MSTTTNKNSSKKSTKAFDGVIQLSYKNARKLERIFKKTTMKSPDVLINQLLDRLQFSFLK